MKTHTIKPLPDSKNWISVINDCGHSGYAVVRRVNGDGEIIQSLTVFPEESLALADLLKQIAGCNNA